MPGKARAQLALDLIPESSPASSKTPSRVGQTPMMTEPATKRSPPASATEEVNPARSGGGSASASRSGKIKLPLVSDSCAKTADAPSVKTSRGPNPESPAAPIQSAPPPREQNLPSSKRSAASPAAGRERKRALGAPAPPPSPKRSSEAPRVHQRPPPVSRRESALRAARIIDLSRPHNTNSQEGALLFALHILTDGAAVWERLRSEGANDAELQCAIARYFPGHLGYHSERQKGFYIGNRPEPFFLWGNAGLVLLKKVRAVLCVPERILPT